MDYLKELLPRLTRAHRDQQLIQDSIEQSIDRKSVV